MDRRLMTLARLAPVTYYLTIVLSLCNGLLIIMQAFLLSRIINGVFLDGKSRIDVADWLIWLLGVIVLRALFQGALQWASAYLATHVKHHFRDRFTQKVTQLGPAFTQHERSGELVNTATQGIEALDAFFRDYLPAIWSALLLPLAVLVVVFPVDLLTFVLFVITAPLIPLFMVLIGMAAGALAKSQYAQMGQMSAHFLDVIQGLTTLKLFNRSQPQRQNIARITGQFRQTTMHVLRVAFLSAFVLELLATISVAVVAVEVGLRLLAGGLPFVQALFILVLAPEFYLPFRTLGAKFHAGRDAAAAAERLFAVMEEITPQAAQGDHTLTDVTAIRFEQVAYSYTDERIGVADVSFSVRRGERVALVGASGSGKTTIANLLLRFVTPTAGKIIVSDGQQDYVLSDLDVDRWRALVAWTPQGSYLFNMSVLENIRLGNPRASYEEVQAAAQRAAADTFIQALPDDYTTLLGENGLRLSGGQAQRVALARAFLRDVPLYVLDEATAGLDSDNERLVRQALFARTADRILIVITHHLDTIRDMDRIIVLDEGRVVEQGTHAELIAQQGAYFHLLQAGSGGANA